MKDCGPTPGYRPCVGVLLFDARGRVFVGRRDDLGFGGWQMPQGGIDDGETPADAARRELAEETGVGNAEIVGEIGRWLDYDLPAELAGKLWGGRWRGQSQKWFAMRFLGDDSDIDLDAHKREFAEWKWVVLDDVPALIVAFKRPVYEAVVAEFRSLVASA